MINNQQIFWLEALPIRVLPEDGESLSSYITRTSEVNKVSNKRLLSLAFPDRIPGSLPLFPDHPLSDYGLLAQLTLQPAEILERATFLWAMKKANYIYCYEPGSLHTITRKPFLPLSSSIRYCPLCLQECNYYRLSWRCLPLKGCNKHGIYFYDQCWRCKANNRLFDPVSEFIPQLGICNNCGADLRNGEPKPLREQDRMLVWMRNNDIDYLLSPHGNTEYTDPYVVEEFSEGHPVDWADHNQTSLIDYLVYKDERECTDIEYDALIDLLERASKEENRKGNIDKYKALYECKMKFVGKPEQMLTEIKRVLRRVW